MWPAPVLDTPADPVTDFDDDLSKLVSNMFETMYAAPGVGLAAVQVGVPKRLFVMDCWVEKIRSSVWCSLTLKFCASREIRMVKRGAYRFPVFSLPSNAACEQSCGHRM